MIDKTTETEVKFAENGKPIAMDDEVLIQAEIDEANKKNTLESRERFLQGVKNSKTLGEKLEEKVKFAWEPKPSEPEPVSERTQTAFDANGNPMILAEPTKPEPPEQEEVEIPIIDQRVRDKILASQKINSCGHCTYWVQGVGFEARHLYDDKINFGECHKNPPLPFLSVFKDESRKIEAGWPPTHATDFCAGACAVDWEGVLRAEAIHAQQQEQARAAEFRTGGPVRLPPPRRRG